MFSFVNGMQTLPRSIASRLGDKVITSAEVTGITKNESGFSVKYISEGTEKKIDADIVYSTLPAYTAAGLFKNFDEGLEKHLNDIYYPPVLVQYLVYDKSSVKQPLDGFGFLIPSKEKKSFLGAIWSSVIFPNRAAESKASFTLFIGGARDSEMVNIDKEVLFKKVRGEFEQIMGISAEPEELYYRFWPKSIPQYNIGYIEHEKYFEEFEKRNPGLVLGGNYRGGISVGDCILNSEKLAQHVLEESRMRFSQVEISD